MIGDGFYFNFSNLDRVDEGKMIEKIVVDVSNQVESNEVGVLLNYMEDEDIEKFKRSVRDKMNSVRIIPVWYMYAFYLIYLFLLSLKSRLIL